MSQIPALTTDQMIEVDRAMLEDYHISLIQMMENAGHNLAHLSRSRFLGGNPRGKTVIILTGAGNNGGGALVCARHLHNWGAIVNIALVKPTTGYRSVPAQQLDALQRMGVVIVDSDSLPIAPGLIVDGLIGYSLSGSPRGAASNFIRWANRQDSPILSLDTPSGLDTTTGLAHEPVIHAAATLTLALPKTGLIQPQAAPFVGELYLADISVPPELYQIAFGMLIPPLFAENDVIRVDLP